MPNHIHKPRAIKNLSRNPFEAATYLDEELSVLTKRGRKQPTTVLAELHGMDAKTIRHYIRVKRQCEPSVLAKLKAGSIRFSHALALASLPHDQQLKAVMKAKELKMKEFREYCSQLRGGLTPQATTLTSKQKLSPDMALFIRYLNKTLGERIDVIFRDKSVVLESMFYTIERATELLKELHADRCKGKVTMTTTTFDQAQHVGTIRLVFKDEEALQSHLIPIGDRLQKGLPAGWGRH